MQETRSSGPAIVEGSPLPMSALIGVDVEVGEVMALMGMLLEARKTTELVEVIFPGASTEPRRITIEKLIGKLRRALDDAAKPRPV
jgi:hypothetical protein